MKRLPMIAILAWLNPIVLPLITASPNGNIGMFCTVIVNHLCILLCFCLASQMSCGPSLCLKETVYIVSGTSLFSPFHQSLFRECVLDQDELSSCVSLCA